MTLCTDGKIRTKEEYAEEEASNENLVAKLGESPNKVEGFDGKVASTPSEGDDKGFLGWRVIWDNEDDRLKKKNDQEDEGDFSILKDGAIMEPWSLGLPSNYGGNLQNMFPYLTNFQQRFDSYLHSLYGEQCQDANCSNIKSKFWKV